MFASLYRWADLARHNGRVRSWEPSHTTGRRGEDIAHRFLQRAGMTVVARNHRTASGSGEVDLVAWDLETLVFVEVKTRTSAEFGPPERAIDEQKQRKLIHAARDYTRRANIAWERVRFDTVSVVLSTPPAVVYQRDVFTVRSTSII